MFNDNLYKIMVILLVSSVLYISTLTYNSLQPNHPFTMQLVPTQNFFTNYTFYGEEKPLLECWSDNNCTDSVIKADILKRLPKSIRDQVEPTLVKTGE